MALMDVGRVCRKTRGKNAGSYAVIVDKKDKHQVLVDGEDVKRCEVNIKHLEPTPYTIKIRKGAQTKSVVDAQAKASLP